MLLCRTLKMRSANTDDYDCRNHWMVFTSSDVTTTQQRSGITPSNSGDGYCNSSGCIPFRALMTSMVPGNTEAIIADNVRYVRLVIEKTLRLAGVASPSATEGDSTHVVSTLSQRRWKLPPAGAISQCISKYRFTASSSCSGCSMIS